MISCARALSAGMQPIFALMVNWRGFNGSRKLGSLANGLAYAGHPVTAAGMGTFGIDEQIVMCGRA